MDKLLLEFERLKKENENLERAFLFYKNVEAPQLLQAKNKERAKEFIHKTELVNELNKLKAELQEKDSEKAKLMLEVGLLKLEFIKLDAELDILKSKEHKKSPVKYKMKIKVEKKIPKIQTEPLKPIVENTVYSSFNCDICKKILSSKIGMSRHLLYKHSKIRNHRKNARSSFSCNICQKILKSKQTLYNHKHNVHSEVRFQCTVCFKDFKQVVTFRRHFRTAHNQKQGSIVRFMKKYVPRDIMPVLEPQC